MVGCGLQLVRAMDAGEKKFPGSKLLFLLDNGPFHRTMPDDALNADAMNASGGGAQPVMRPGWFWDKRNEKQPQLMVDSKGQPKGMERVLAERGLLQRGMDKARMAAVLREEDDFKEQPTVLQEMAAKRGHRLLYLPKFHAELSAVEPCFRSGKRTVRDKGILSLPQLRSAVLPALHDIPLPFIRAYHEKVRAFLSEYRSGADFTKAKADLQASEKSRRAARAEREKAREDRDEDIDMEPASTVAAESGSNVDADADADADTNADADADADVGGSAGSSSRSRSRKPTQLKPTRASSRAASRARTDSSAAMDTSSDHESKVRPPFSLH